MRVAIVTESFPPDINGVSHCALQTAQHLARRGHDPLVLAPAGAQDCPADSDGTHPYPVVRVPSLPLPGYPQVRVALPSRRVAATLTAHRTDVVHLASPFILGVRGMAAAARLHIPAVAVYQTDIGGYARTYLGTGEGTAWRRIRAVHAAADRTLAPSTAAARDLTEHGVPRVALWPRGVDTERFRPAARDLELRRTLAPGGELIVGYVGRLAPEKCVELLAPVNARPDVKLVVVGDGPSASGLRSALPGAQFLGRRTGEELARIFASLDVFAHTGPQETFCQTVQEAQASGVPVIAPAVGGPLDLIAHGRTGLLVSPGDSTAVLDAVALLAESPRLRADLGRAGRAAVEGRTWQVVGDLLLDHYAEVLAERAGRVTEGRAA
ncbi:glycosyltransferase family 4 protein [Streptomyces zagrosensis]|uniref:Phosphatidylinositol alpha 1,6-mannosyltransferase n=1 Tax=Streptomyces zagrosensis TaxID=1042984 RepID=A0A7W9Q8J9_9ACTN|nr:glycosyltransferase family 1 protein [Streptomyces zagrosensis]MBB5935334.1 phosphatidylinositol alpha 1,6-mannosyltransferase [Streptomyces zagrosensis]